MLTVDFDRTFSSDALLRDLQRLQGEMNQVFTRSPMLRTSQFPAVNIWQSQEGLILTCELPGVDPGSLEISVVGDSLTLGGARAPQPHNHDDAYHRGERIYGKFSRTLQLPYRIEASEVSADFKNGVLTITLPRAAADRPRKIQVKTA